MSHTKRVEVAIEAFKNGKPVILTDDPDRENEGDLIMPAELMTPDIMNFMIRQGTGIVCLSLPQSHLQKLALPQMVARENNTSFKGTPFSISIDARDGITTGVSSFDRVKTVLTAIADDVTPDDLVKPGHIFPLEAQDDGVLKRQGHTEGALDLAKIGGFKPAAVLCEIMNPDGSMAAGQQIIDFANQYQLPLLSIADIIAYRLQQEILIEDETETLLPIENYGTFKLIAFREKLSQQEHMILIKEKENPLHAPLIRIHSSCQTGDLFASKRCDCHHQLHYSLKQISEEGGMLIYLNQEGRGIGLLNKIKAYALQEQGFDTVDANIQLGLPVDAREYYIAAHILRKYQMTSVRLLTNNLAKIDGLKKYGITDIKRCEMPIFQNQNNQSYLRTKKEKLNQAIRFE